jgi:hypothetical protein
MQEPYKQTLAESLIPSKNEKIGVLAANQSSHFQYFLMKIEDAAKRNLKNNFIYIRDVNDLSGRYIDKIIRLKGWSYNKPHFVCNEIDDQLRYRKIEVIDIDDRDLDKIIN